MIEEKTIDRNQIIGFLLIAGILIGLSWWTSSQETSTVPEEEKIVIESKESLDIFSMDSTSSELEEKISVDSSFEFSKEYILENEKVSYSFIGSCSLFCFLSRASIK